MLPTFSRRLASKERERLTPEQREAKERETKVLNEAVNVIHERQTLETQRRPPKTSTWQMVETDLLNLADNAGRKNPSNACAAALQDAEVKAWIKGLELNALTQLARCAKPGLENVTRLASAGSRGARWPQLPQRKIGHPLKARLQCPTPRQSLVWLV